MLSSLNTYRRFLYSILLTAYVFTTFQKPVLEIIHLIAHSVNWTVSGFTYHSFAAHSEDHHHAFFSMIKEETGKGDAHKTPSSEKEVKKKVEMITPETPIALSEGSSLYPAFLWRQSMKTYVKDTSDPPPKFS